ncbi:MAG: hypothetical protein Q4C89_12065 [Deinococcus sp.]|uniref:hypothetical protein n=1 Tax=Deinococcus sp. TaxID=47478 RepID=UPI0026DDC4F2|nr:hypothetical protein [Deinococcus sp.]MDO4246750.1 hypothetical protein [Deinococcus sp.]
MGEAKRRKQLGLMPTIYPFKVRLDRDGQTEWLQGAPADVQPQLDRLMREGFTVGDAWDAEYRTLHVLTDYSGTRYDTQADLARIAVPRWRQIEGELALGGQPGQLLDSELPIEGGKVRLRERSTSFDGETWQPLIAPRDPQHMLKMLNTHPAFRLEGEVLGQYQADHWQAGRIDISPDLPENAPEGLLEYLEELVSELHGQTPQEWQQLHAEALETFEVEQAEDADTPPVARRLFFELRRAAPLQTPVPPVGGFGGLEVHLLDGMAYSPDGEVWHPYEDPEQTFENALAPELAEFFDLNVVTVTVHADGRLEWDEDDELSEDDIQQLKTDLLESTGAGDPAAWKTWTHQALTETFGEELNLPADADFPVPVAVRLDIPRDVLGDDNPLSQTYMESEVTFDGENWRDLYDEEIPEELLPFAAGQGSN